MNCGSEKYETVLTIPPVARVTAVREQPTTLIVAVDTEHVRIAVRIGIVQRAIRTTTL